LPTKKKKKKTVEMDDQNEIEGIYMRQHSGSVESLDFEGSNNRVTYLRAFTQLNKEIAYECTYEVLNASDEEGADRTLVVRDEQGEILVEMSLDTFAQSWFRKTTVTTEVFIEED
jgi:hypothetical protein